jgi:hypothetical protein
MFQTPFRTASRSGVDGVDRHAVFRREYQRIAHEQLVGNIEDPLEIQVPGGEPQLAVCRQ